MPDQSVSAEGNDNLPTDKRLSCASVNSSTSSCCVFCVDNVSLEASWSGAQDFACDYTSRTKLESLCVIHKHLSHEIETSELKSETEVSNKSCIETLSTGLCALADGLNIPNESTTKANIYEKTKNLTNTITLAKSPSVDSTLDSDSIVSSEESLPNNVLVENGDLGNLVNCHLSCTSVFSGEPNAKLVVGKENCADEHISSNTIIKHDGNLASVDKDGAHFNKMADYQTETESGELQSCEVPENIIYHVEDSTSDLTLSDDVESSTEWTDDQLEKINTIKSQLTQSVLDLSTLQELAAQSDGFVSDSIRRQVWPRLLHLQDATPIVLLTRQESEGHSSYTQVVLDVERTLKRFPPGISPDKRRVLMDHLIRVILTVLTRNPDMHYYQGYHDVGITLLLVCGHEAAPLLLEELSLTHLREFLQPTMERTQRWLAFLFPMLADTCPALHQHMMKASVGAVFCLAWLITWYAHTLSQYRQVVRLYDFLLASPPLMPMYIAAEILRHREQELLQVECDMAMLHHALSQVPDDLPLDHLLQEARLLYRRLPPSSLAEQVDQYLLKEKQREQAERLERERMRAARRPTPARSSWVARVWALATPRRLYGVHGAAAVAMLAVATALYFRSYGVPRMLQW